MSLTRFDYVIKEENKKISMTVLPEDIVFNPVPKKKSKRGSAPKLAKRTRRRGAALLQECELTIQ